MNPDWSCLDFLVFGFCKCGNGHNGVVSIVQAEHLFSSRDILPYQNKVKKHLENVRDQCGRSTDIYHKISHVTLRMAIVCCGEKKKKPDWYRAWLCYKESLNSIQQIPELECVLKQNLQIKNLYFEIIQRYFRFVVITKSGKCVGRKNRRDLSKKLYFLLNKILNEENLDKEYLKKSIELISLYGKFLTVRNESSDAIDVFNRLMNFEKKENSEYYYFLAYNWDHLNNDDDNKPDEKSNKQEYEIAMEKSNYYLCKANQLYLERKETYPYPREIGGWMKRRDDDDHKTKRMKKENNNNNNENKNYNNYDNYNNKNRLQSDSYTRSNSGLIATFATGGNYYNNSLNLFSSPMNVNNMNINVGINSVSNVSQVQFYNNYRGNGLPDRIMMSDLHCLCPEYLICGSCSLKRMKMNCIYTVHEYGLENELSKCRDGQVCDFLIDLVIYFEQRLEMGEIELEQNLLININKYIETIKCIKPIITNIKNFQNKIENNNKIRCHKKMLQCCQWVFTLKCFTISCFRNFFGKNSNSNTNQIAIEWEKWIYIFTRFYNIPRSIPTKTITDNNDLLKDIVTQSFQTNLSSLIKIYQCNTTHSMLIVINNAIKANILKKWHEHFESKEIEWEYKEKKMKKDGTISKLQRGTKFWCDCDCYYDYGVKSNPTKYPILLKQIKKYVTEIISQLLPNLMKWIKHNAPNCCNGNLYASNKNYGIPNHI